MELQHPLNDSPVIDGHPSEALSASTHQIELWDWPLRLFHWALVAAVSVAIVTGKIGGDWMAVHGKAGIAIVGLLAFRVVWGFIGSTHARFSSFVPTPGSILRYLKGIWFGVGHNPLGALSVIALLTVLGFQAGSGLVANDDIAFTGPLISLVQESTSQRLTALHHLVANGLFVLVGLHVVAILAYLILKKTNLVGPMVTGQKKVPQHIDTPQRFKTAGLLVALTLSLGSTWLASGQWITDTPAPATDAQASTPATSPTTTQPAQAQAAW